MSSQPTRYGATQRALHWITVLLVLPMIAAGFVMVQNGLSRGVQDTLYIFHKNTGVVVFCLVVLRILWRLTHSGPPAPSFLPLWQQRIASATHGLLYVLVLLMPVSGYIRVRAGNFPIEGLDSLGLPHLVPRSEALATAASGLHMAGALALTLLIAMHAGAALHHLVIRRDGIWSRMWPPFGRD